MDNGQVALAKPYRIGIDIGGTGVKVGIVGADHNIITKGACETRADHSYQTVVADIAGLVRRLLEEAGIGIDQCEKMGIGSPGMIDHKGGNVVFAANLGWEQAPLLAEMGRHFDLPMKLANDADCAVYGETLAGAAKGCRHVVLLTLGTGIGGGVVCDMVLQQGGSAGGMELGHVLLVKDGEACTCGRRGCVEAYASATALIRQAKKAAELWPSSILGRLYKESGKMTGKLVFEAVGQGCETAGIVWAEYVEHLGDAIVDCVNIWRPEVVLLGGGVSHAGDVLIGPVNAYVKPRCFAGDRGHVAEIKVAALGNDAGLIGAAAL